MGPFSPPPEETLPQRESDIDPPETKGTPAPQTESPPNISRTVSNAHRSHAVPCTTPSGEHHDDFTPTPTHPGALLALAPPRPPIPPLSSLTTRAYHTHTRAHFTPQHWLLCHMGLY